MSGRPPDPGQPSRPLVQLQGGAPCRRQSFRQGKKTVDCAFQVRCLLIEAFSPVFNLLIMAAPPDDRPEKMDQITDITRGSTGRAATEPPASASPSTSSPPATTSQPPQPPRDSQAPSSSSQSQAFWFNEAVQVPLPPSPGRDYTLAPATASTVAAASSQPQTQTHGYRTTTAPQTQEPQPQPQTDRMSGTSDADMAAYFATAAVSPGTAGAHSGSGGSGSSQPACNGGKGGCPAAGTSWCKCPKK